MVGFPSHFGFGLVLSLPFVAVDKKNRYRTLLVGGLAAAAPDVDAPAMVWDLSILGLEHRGVLHGFGFWLTITFFYAVVVSLAAYDLHRRANSTKVSGFVYDKALYLGALLVGWLSHLVVDFGLTDFENDKGWVYSLSLLEI